MKVHCYLPLYQYLVIMYFSTVDIVLYIAITFIRIDHLTKI